MSPKAESQGVDMVKQSTLGILFSLLGIAHAVADSPGSVAVKKVSCSIELGMLKAPTAYLVAMVQRPGERQCDASGCIETLTVVKVLAAGGGIDAHPTSISLAISTNDRNDASEKSKGTKSVGVYIPARNSKLFALLSETLPANPDVIANYEQAIAVAKAAPAGAPDCSKEL
jgi:hypothetical protein